MNTHILTINSKMMSFFVTIISPFQEILLYRYEYLLLKDIADNEVNDGKC